MRRGMTLLEVLIAITMLAMISAVVIPLMVRMGSRHAHGERQQLARSILADLPAPAVLAALNTPAAIIASHPDADAYLEVTSLRPPVQTVTIIAGPVVSSPGQPAPFRWDPLPRSWIHVVIRGGPEPDAEILAEDIRLLPPPTTQSAADADETTGASP